MRHDREINDGIPSLTVEINAALQQKQVAVNSLTKSLQKPHKQFNIVMVCIRNRTERRRPMAPQRRKDGRSVV